MTENIERPKIVTNEHLEYLNNLFKQLCILRESGVTNMYGAGEYIEREFSTNRKDSSIILTYWMKSFEERKLV